MEQELNQNGAAAEPLSDSMPMEQWTETRNTQVRAAKESPTESPEPEAQEADQETSQSEDVQRGRRERQGGGFQRRIAKLTQQKHAAANEAKFWREKAIAAGVAPLSDDLDTAEWTRRRNAQVAAGVPYTESQVPPNDEGPESDNTPQFDEATRERLMPKKAAAGLGFP
jgi:hypothetical protein